jgi:hypothetical protein
MLDDEIHHLGVRRLPPVRYRPSLFEALASVGSAWLRPAVRWASAPPVADLGALDFREGTRQQGSDGGATGPLVTGVKFFQELDVAVETHQ